MCTEGPKGPFAFLGALPDPTQLLKMDFLLGGD